MKIRIKRVSALLPSLALSGCFVGCAVDSIDSESLQQELAFGGTPAAIPGRVQAEDYDTEGPGSAFNDATAGNSGAQYRSDDVDIEVSSQGGFNVGWIAAGEWLDYSVNVQNAGSHSVRVSVASQTAGGTFHLEVNGQNVSGPVTFAATGGWQTWTTVQVDDVQLPAGQFELRLVADSSGFNLDYLDFAFTGSVAGQAPYGGSAVNLPGTIEAEDYDEGGVDVAYSDSSAGNSGGQHRDGDVDIEASSQGGFNVGWMAAGEWLEYTVTSAGGTFDVALSVASQSSGGALHFEVNGQNVSGPISFNATGGWQTWVEASGQVTLPSGTSVLRLVSDGSGFNVDSFALTQEAPPPPTGSSDPTCSTGILNAAGTACCDAACGSCGGTGCDARPGGAANCCTSGVTAGGALCSGNLPPCLMGGGDPGPGPGSAPSADQVIDAMGPGFNLGNVFDNGGNSSNFATNAQIIDLYENAGMKHVRFPVTWIDSVGGSSLANSNGDVNFNHSRFLALVQLIDYALDKGLYVVLNTHHEHWLKDNYNGSETYNAPFRNLWQDIANYFEGYPPQLIFEVLNEPEGAFGDWSPPGPNPTGAAVQQLTRDINLVGYNAIRGTGGNNSTRVIMVAPNAQGNQSMIDEVYPNQGSLPGGGSDNYLAIQVHSYDPWSFCGQTGSNSSWPGAASIQNNIQTVANHAASLGVPINYGEFGVGRQNNQAERNTDLVRGYYSTFADKTLSVGMSYTVWDDRGWFGLVNSSGTSFTYNIVPTMLN